MDDTRLIQQGAHELPSKLFLRAYLIVAITLASGCSVDQPGSARGLVANPTPLATEPSAPKPTPKPKSTSKPKATPKPGSFYKPRGWDGYSDVNCSEFDKHAHAQSFFKGTGGSKSSDRYGLDSDHDGLACETLP
jgi:hypothetical protein